MMQVLRGVMPLVSEVALSGSVYDYVYGSGYGYGFGFGYEYGYGYGDGYGYGFELGSGYGYGYGYGDGYGDGDGNGYGDGYGDGHVHGHGHGHGSGYGYGSGDGHCYCDWLGYGYGSGDGYWEKIAQPLVADAAQSLPECLFGFWKSDANAKPCNGGCGEAVKVGDVQEISGPLEICHRALHASLNPQEWKGDRLWLVALSGEVQRDGDKMGALKREIIAEIV